MKKKLITITFLLLNFIYLYPQQFSVDDIIETNSNIEKKYNITFLINNIKKSDFTKMWTTFDELTDEDVTNLNDYIEIFKTEFNKYPVSIIKTSKLKSIAFVKNLKYATECVSYFPDAFGETIYFNVEYGHYAKEYIRIIIHHSFFNMLEETVNKSIFFEDPEWQDINNDNEIDYKERPKKGSEGKEYDYKEHPSEGFVNTYASYSIDKDMGQTFAYLMISEKNIQINKWIKKDTALNEKINYMKKFIYGVSNEMNNSFFEKIANPEINDSKEDQEEYAEEDKETDNDKGKYVEYGKASFYGKKYNGKKTASGEIFDDTKLTAAHKTLTFGTYVKVINEENNKSVVVKINDRGPFVKGRIIDLATKAAEKIDMISSGIANVRIEVVDNEENSENINEKEEEEDSYFPDFNKLYSTLSKTDAANLKSFVNGGIQNPIDIKNLTATNLVNSAKKYLGVPYVSGGTSYNGMDCSGFTYKAFSEWGVDIPRDGLEQAKYGKFISNKNDLQPGDLVFFTRTYNTSKFITHTGIYSGNKKFINANSYYGRVMEDIIDDNYWKQYYIFGVRYF